MTKTVAVLDEVADDGDRHPFTDAAFLAALTQLIPLDGLSLLELDAAAETGAELPLISAPDADAGDDAFWDHFWTSLPCSFTERGGARAKRPATVGDFYSDAQWRSSGMYAEVFRPSGLEWDLIVPLPSAPGLSRRLVMFRGPGPAFTSHDVDVARILQPHLADAVKRHGRARAASVLTARQRELLGLCAQGLDNTRIARRLDVAPGTVRKHLENAFARLGVSSRTEAIAAVHPDLRWA